MMKESLFDDRKIDTDKLLRFGFVKEHDAYIWRTILEKSQMPLEVTVKDNQVYTRVLDPEFGEEYTLHHVSEQNGSFVSAVRHDYLAWMHKILETCTVIDSFLSPDALFIKKYIRDTYGDELEYLWKTADAAVVRRADTRKWYACFMHISRQKLGFDDDEVIEIVNFHTKSERMDSLLDGRSILPGFHMNKKYWFTVCLDGTVPHDRLVEFIQFSYALAKTKK